MNFIAPRAEPLIREIPLSRLALAPENVRKTPSDPRADAELKASIAALGLLENLVARADEPGEDPGSGEPAPATEPGGQAVADRFAVVAGGRRLKAMQALVEDGVFDPEHPVPCLVRADGDEAGEVSLAENVVRIAMHPADQVVAFTKLVQAGQSVSSVAARFGLSERLVEQRLRLGNAAPELLDAYRADEIDLEVLKAFAVTTDRERQMKVWEQVSGQGYRPSAWQVKRLLTEERVPGATAVARFVGVEAYEAGCGDVLRPDRALRRQPGRAAPQYRSGRRIRRGPCLDPARDLRGARPQGPLCEGPCGPHRGITGIDDPWEPPEHPDVEIDTTDIPPGLAARRILAKLESLGYIRQTRHAQRLAGEAGLPGNARS